MAIGRVLVVVSAILLALPPLAAAQVFGCGRFETLADCNNRLSLAQQVMAEEMRKTPEPYRQAR